MIAFLIRYEAYRPNNEDEEVPGLQAEAALHERAVGLMKRLQTLSMQQAPDSSKSDAPDAPTLAQLAETPWELVHHRVGGSSSEGKHSPMRGTVRIPAYDSVETNFFAELERPSGSGSGSEILGRSEAELEMHSGSEMPPHPKGRTPGGKRRGGKVGGS